MYQYPKDHNKADLYRGGASGYPKVNKRLILKSLEHDLMMRNWKFKDDKFFTKNNYEGWVMRDKIKNLKEEYDDDVNELKYDAKKKITDAPIVINDVFKREKEIIQNRIDRFEDQKDLANSRDELEELNRQIGFQRSDMKSEIRYRNDALEYLRRK